MFAMFKRFFAKKPQIEFIDVTRELLGVFFPINAPSIAKVIAARKVQKRIEELWQIKKCDACRFSIVITFPNDTKIDPAQLSPYVDEWLLFIAMEKMHKKRFYKKSIANMYIVDWYFGNFFKGSFTKNGKTFDATSQSIQICGISREILEDFLPLLVQNSAIKDFLILDYFEKVLFIQYN